MFLRSYHTISYHTMDMFEYDWKQKTLVKLRDYEVCLLCVQWINSPIITDVDLKVVASRLQFRNLLPITTIHQSERLIIYYKVIRKLG